MEVRVIKTCQGFETVRFLDGTLLSADAHLIELCEGAKLQLETELSEWLKSSADLNLNHWSQIEIPQ